MYGGTLSSLNVPRSVFSCNYGFNGMSGYVKTCEFLFMVDIDDFQVCLVIEVMIPEPSGFGGEPPFELLLESISAGFYVYRLKVAKLRL